MQRELKTLDDLQYVDGGNLNRDFQLCMIDAVDDCVQRPAIKKTRTVYVKIVLEPVVGDDGGLVEIRSGFAVHTKVPPRIAMEHVMTAGPDRTLHYNEASPDDPKQGTLDEMIEDADAE